MHPYLIKSSPVGLPRIQVSLKTSQHLPRENLMINSMIKTSGKDSSNGIWLGKFPWFGVDQMICGGGFTLNQKQTFFSSQTMEQANFFPYITPFSASFVNKVFIFYSLLNKLFFHHVLLNNFFFSNKP